MFKHHELEPAACGEDGHVVLASSRDRSECSIDIAWSTTRMPSLVHGDLGAGNVLWPLSGAPVVIDWEDSRFGDAAEDVAYAVTENRLDATQRRALLSSYTTVRAVPAAFIERVAAWEAVTALGSGLWWVVRAARRTAIDAGMSDDDGSTPRPAQDYLRQGLERLRWFSPSVR